MGNPRGILTRRRGTRMPPRMGSWQPERLRYGAATKNQWVAEGFLERKARTLEGRCGIHGSLKSCERIGRQAGPEGAPPAPQGGTDAFVCQPRDPSGFFTVSRGFRVSACRSRLML